MPVKNQKKSAPTKRRISKKAKVSLLHRLVTSKKFPFVIIVAVAGPIGLYMLLSTYAATPTIRIATYNILGSNHVEKGREVGGSVSDRADRATRIIRGGVDGIGAFDVVGMQEMMPDQYAMFKNRLPAYDTIPKASSSQRAIFYRRDRVKVLSSGTLLYPSYGAENLTPNTKARWAKFLDLKTNQRFYVLNAHPSSWNMNPGSDKGGALKRERTARIIQNWVTNKQKSGLAIFVLGDMNSAYYLRTLNNYPKRKDDALDGNRNRLPYCIHTKMRSFQSAYDMYKGRTGYCPTKSGNLIDHIYATTRNVKIVGWKRISPTQYPVAARASDHMPILVNASIFGTVATTQVATLAPSPVIGEVVEETVNDPANANVNETPPPTDSEITSDSDTTVVNAPPEELSPEPTSGEAEASSDPPATTE